MADSNPILIEILRNAFNSLAQEMNACLFRSAFSPIIYEMKDCSVGIFNAAGEMLGQSAGLPIFLGNLGVCVDIINDRFGNTGLHEGDVFIMNDVYLQGTHLNDVTVVAPIFYQEALVGFSANRAHMQDIGGSVSRQAREIYEEGLRIPPIRLLEQGVLREDLLELFALNSRCHHELKGDISAQVSACRIGALRLRELYEQFGSETIRSATHEIFHQSEILDASSVRQIPDGLYHAEGFLDNDAIGTDPLKVKVKVTVRDENMVIDLSGSAPIATGPVNCGYAQAVAACRVAFKNLVNPNSVITGGNFKNLKVVVPEKSIFSAEEPAPCGVYFSSLGLLIDLIARALAPAIPARVAAAHYGDSMAIGFRGYSGDTGDYFFAGEPTVGGWGAYQDGDGETCLINAVNGDFKNLPTEFLEKKYPVRSLRYEIRQDSEGAGEYRGGFGVIREYQILVDGCSLQSWCERSVTKPWGLFTDEEAKGPWVVVGLGSENERLLLKASDLPVKAGTIVQISTGGGGGFGNPVKRERERVRYDVENGYISPQRAAAVYKQVFDDYPESR